GRESDERAAVGDRHGEHGADLEVALAPDPPVEPSRHHPGGHGDVLHAHAIDQRRPRWRPVDHVVVAAPVTATTAAATAGGEHKAQHGSGPHALILAELRCAPCTNVGPSFSPAR